MKTTRFIIILIAVVFGGAPLHAQEERAGQGRPAVENPCEVTNAQLHQDLSEIIELQNKIYDEKLELIESNTKKDNLKDGWNAHGWCAIALPHPPQVPLAQVREIVPAHRT